MIEVALFWDAVGETGGQPERVGGSRRVTSQAEEMGVCGVHPVVSLLVCPRKQRRQGGEPGSGSVGHAHCNRQVERHRR